MLSVALPREMESGELGDIAEGAMREMEGFVVERKSRKGRNRDGIARTWDFLYARKPYRIWEPWLDCFLDIENISPGLPSFPFLIPLIPVLGQAYYAHAMLRRGSCEFRAWLLPRERYSTLNVYVGRYLTDVDSVRICLPHPGGVLDVHKDGPFYKRTLPYRLELEERLKARLASGTPSLS